MIKHIREINFPDYATLEQATVTINDMGDRSISTQVKIDGSVVPDFSYDWEVEFKGERYIHPIRKPQGTKDNGSMSAKIDMVFYHWAIYEMKRHYFVEMASTTAGTAVADKYIASLGLNLGNFVTAFNLVLKHYFGDRIVVRLNPDWQYDAEAQLMSISYSYIWDVLQQMHEIYGVRWTLKTNAEGVCEILMGYPAEEVSHVFEYGFEGGLLSVQRQVQSTDIRNRLLGRGGEKNLPYRYFKDKDPNNPLFEADPDWIPELANIAFTELRGKTFRDYVKGWKAKRYGGTVMAEPTEAYLAGYNAEKFDPIEYVEDKESIAKYGVLVGALENNEDIYPSIQNAPGEVDTIVDAEQVTDDDVDASVEEDSVTTNLESGHQTYRNAPANSIITIETATKRYFSVPDGKIGNLDMSLTVTGKNYYGSYEETYPILKTDTVKVTVYDKVTGSEIKSSGVPMVNIPSGDYYYMVKADVDTNYAEASMITLNIESVHLYVSTPEKPSGWKNTFDVWVRNIWGSSRNSGETDQQYADRVWAPILGDRTGGEARVVFASGWLSFSSDWEFPIVGYAYDDSKNGSHWRLTLAKSEAELEASGKYIPHEGYNASAGDRFFFIGIDMPYQYVLWAEERLDSFKRDSLLKTSDINPTWVIKTDKVRLNQDREGAVLVDSLNAGAQIRLASKQFVSGAYETLYVQSVTYTWNMDTILHPDIEVVVSDKVHTVKNPVAQIQSSIETIQRQVGSLSNIQQIIRQVCDTLYLRKDGVSDISKSPTKFLGRVSGEKFREGQIGGRDWGIYRDGNGNAILEADKVIARQGIFVNDLVINEATYVGGLQINSAASMTAIAVEETDEGYVCFFDQKQGTVINKFKTDDVVLCHKFDAEDKDTKFYKARVIAVNESSVTLSKTEINGTGIPAVDDKIIHYGNYTDKGRQFVIIRDVIGGGYERMLMGLDSVTSEGFEYYFAGKSSDSKARWFVGNTEQYAKYENGQFTIKGNLFVTGSDKPISYITEALGDSAEGLILGSAIIVGYNNEDGIFVPMAGMSGVFDKDNKTGGPAAWYGGTLDEAKIVFNMDGSGYLADENIRWDKFGAVTFSDKIKISTEGNETLGSILTMLAVFNDMFYFADENTIGTKYNFFSEKENSAGGKGESIGTSGGGGDGDLTGYATEEWVQNQGYATKAEIPTKVSDLPNDAEYVTEWQADGKYVIWKDDFEPLQKKVDGIDERVTALEATGGTGSGDIDLKAYATKEWVEKQGYALSSSVDAKQDKITDLEAIREGAALGATALQSVPDGYATTNDLDKKVDKVSGMGLSTNDYTDAEKTKLASLKNYEDSEVKADIATLEGYFINGKAKDADKLDGHDYTYFATASSVNSLSTTVTSLENDMADVKQDISDINGDIEGITARVTKAEEDISQNKGDIEGIGEDVTSLMTWYNAVGSKFSKDADGTIKMEGDFYTTGENSAGGVGESVGGSGGGLDESQLEDYLTDNHYVTETWVNQQGFATGTIPTMVSQLTNDRGYITSADIPDIPDIPDAYTKQEITELLKGYTTTDSHNTLAGKVTTAEAKIAENAAKIATNTTNIATNAANISENSDNIEDLDDRMLALEEWFGEVGQYFKYDAANEAWYLDGNFYTKGENSANGAGEDIIDFAEVVTRVTQNENAIKALSASGPNLVINFQELKGLNGTTVTNAALGESVGLTNEAVNGLLDARYNKVIGNGTYREVWNYTAHETASYIEIYLRKGYSDLAGEWYHLHYDRTTQKWDITRGDI